MSVKARCRRMLIALVLVCASLGVVVQRVSADAPKRDAKLFADIYKSPGTSLDNAIERLTAKAKHGEGGQQWPAHCGEYQCEWNDPGSSGWTCYPEGQVIDGGFLQCACWESGQCVFVPYQGH